MKKNIIIFILGGLVFTGISALATNLISAEQINYDENTTVKDKIDDLYTKATTSKYEYIGFTYAGKNQGDNSSVVLSKAVSKKGKYLIVVAVALRNNGRRANEQRGTLSGCDNISSTVPSYSNIGYESSTTCANLLYNIFTCTTTGPATITFTSIKNDDDTNANMAVFKVD